VILLVILFACSRVDSWLLLLLLLLLLPSERDDDRFCLVRVDDAP
jgi:hypothetical protein